MKEKEDGRMLQQCLLELQRSGHSWILNSGAKIFVRPHQWEMVMEAVAGKDLRTYHVIVAEEFKHLLEDTVRQIRCRSRPKFKCTELEIEPSSTFLCFAPETPSTNALDCTAE